MRYWRNHPDGTLAAYSARQDKRKVSGACVGHIEIMSHLCCVPQSWGVPRGCIEALLKVGRTCWYQHRNGFSAWPLDLCHGLCDTLITHNAHARHPRHTFMSALHLLPTPRPRIT